MNPKEIKRRNTKMGIALQVIIFFPSHFPWIKTDHFKGRQQPKSTLVCIPNGKKAVKTNKNKIQ